MQQLQQRNGNSNGGRRIQKADITIALEVSARKHNIEVVTYLVPVKGSGSLPQRRGSKMMYRGQLWDGAGGLDENTTRGRRNSRILRYSFDVIDASVTSAVGAELVGNSVSGGGGNRQWRLPAFKLHMYCRKASSHALVNCKRKVSVKSLPWLVLSVGN